MAELVGGCVAMFLFKQGSRNAMNDARYEGKFAKNYFRLFRKLKLPHMDTVNALMRLLNEEELEKLKATFVKVLIKKKVFHSSRFLGKYFCVAVDGTGLFSFEEQHCDHCLKKTIQEACVLLPKKAISVLRDEGFPKWILDSLKELCGQTFETKEVFLQAFEKKTGPEIRDLYQEQILAHLVSKSEKVVYSHHVLEAKLVTENGFSISLASEWIENPGEEYQKQDCELKAAKRLAETLKKHFPQLPICLVVDGLYPNEPFFQLCQEKQWQFMVVLKDDTLKSVQEKVQDALKLHEEQQRSRQYREGVTEVEQRCQWLNGIEYRGRQLNWIELTETITSSSNGEIKTTRFVWLSSQALTYHNCLEVTEVGRRRWKIENQGFNCQKNLGYELQHQYSRTSLLAAKNYYQCLQIAHMINQLCEFAQATQDKLKQWKVSFKHLWKTLFASLVHESLDEEDLEAFSRRKVQFRYG